MRVAAGAVVFKAATTNEIKFTVNRLRGFDHKLRAELRELPPGVHVEAFDLGEKSGEQTLKVICDSDAKAAQQAVRLIVVDTTASREYPAEFEFVSASENNGVPGGYTKLLVESSVQIWFTVIASSTK